MNKTNFTINALAIAFVAVFIEQVGHESSHGILATLVGAQWTQLNLFFAEHTWAGDMNQAGEAILTGGALVALVVAEGHYRRGARLLACVPLTFGQCLVWALPAWALFGESKRASMARCCS